MRVKQRLLDVLGGMDIVTFLQFDGKPPDTRPHSPTARETKFSEFRDSYLRTFGGAVESNTLYTAKIHLKHFENSLGVGFPINTLTTADLQRHVDRRVKAVSGTTVRKEIDTLRAAWNWAARMEYVQGPFPGGVLVYPKIEEKLPFMTWKEIERRIRAGGDPDELWECLYLTVPEMDDFLDFAQAHPRQPWPYPMCVMAAHTGARRSEMMQAERQDVDLEAGIITIREKKKRRGRITTRRVPISTK